MAIRVTTLKSLVWFCAILLIVLSFPIQVYVNNPYPALLPYALCGLVLLLTWAFPCNRAPGSVAIRRRRNIDRIIGIYVFMVVFNTAWQTGLGFVPAGEAGGAFVNYLLPVVFYLYFSRVASEREIRAVLYAAVIGGVIVGVYFAYDSYGKLALGQVSDYSKRAFDYSLGRANLTAGEVNDARVSANFRSFGLLESHSVSGAWVMIGAFASIALLPDNRRIARRLVVLVFAAMLLLGLNFTSIVVFSIIMLIFEFGGLSLIRWRFSPRLAVQIASLAVILLVLIGGAFWVVGDTMSQFIVANLLGQRNLALGTGGVDQTMLSITLANISGYCHHILEFPVTLLLGDGVTSYGIAKGGDIGFIETLARFGLPLFSAILVGLARLVRAGLGAIQYKEDVKTGRALRERRIILFGVSVILLVLFTEGHYTVWVAKSILPIVFFALALMSRYLPRSRVAPAPHAAGGK